MMERIFEINNYGAALISNGDYAAAVTVFGEALQILRVVGAYEEANAAAAGYYSTSQQFPSPSWSAHQGRNSPSDQESSSERGEHERGLHGFVFDSCQRGGKEQPTPREITRITSHDMFHSSFPQGTFILSSPEHFPSPTSAGAEGTSNRNSDFSSFHNGYHLPIHAGAIVFILQEDQTTRTPPAEWSVEESNPAMRSAEDSMQDDRIVYDPSSEIADLPFVNSTEREHLQLLQTPTLLFCSSIILFNHALAYHLKVLTSTIRTSSEATTLGKSSSREELLLHKKLRKAEFLYKDTCTVLQCLVNAYVVEEEEERQRGGGQAMCVEAPSMALVGMQANRVEGSPSSSVSISDDDVSNVGNVAHVSFRRQHQQHTSYYQQNEHVGALIEVMSMALLNNIAYMHFSMRNIPEGKEYVNRLFLWAVSPTAVHYRDPTFSAIITRIKDKFLHNSIFISCQKQLFEVALAA